MAALISSTALCHLIVFSKVCYAIHLHNKRSSPCHVQYFLPLLLPLLLVDEYFMTHVASLTFNNYSCFFLSPHQSLVLVLLSINCYHGFSQDIGFVSVLEEDALDEWCKFRVQQIVVVFGHVGKQLGQLDELKCLLNYKIDSQTQVALHSFCQLDVA